MSDGTPAPHDPTVPTGPPPGQAPQGYAPQGAYPPAGGYPPQGAYPPQGGPVPGPPASSPFGSSSTGVSLWLGLASVTATTLAVLLKEDDVKAWDSIGVWVIFAIVSSVLTLAASIGGSLNLSKENGWKVGAAGAVGLLAFWVLHVLPAISKNLSFLATVGVAAGIGAVWFADGRPEPAGDGSVPETW